MRVTEISLYSNNERKATFSLKVRDPLARYIIRNIAGLDAMDIITRFYGFGLATKPKYYEFNLKPRDVVMRITLNPIYRLNESASEVRDELYRAISSNRSGQVALHFNSEGTLVARLYGFITKFEASYFTPQPEVQITVRCEDPTFRAINPVIYKPSELGTTNPVMIADSISTAPHGFNMQVTFKATSPSFTVQDGPTNPEWMFKITPSGGFLSGDVLYISSEYLNKYAYMVRSGVTTYLVDRIEPNSIWPTIFPGMNYFHFVDLAKFDWNTLEYYAAYWGV